MGVDKRMKDENTGHCKQVLVHDQIPWFDVATGLAQLFILFVLLVRQRQQLTRRLWPPSERWLPRSWQRRMPDNNVRSITAPAQAVCHRLREGLQRTAARL